MKLDIELNLLLRGSLLLRITILIQSNKKCIKNYNNVGKYIYKVSFFDFLNESDVEHLIKLSYCLPAMLSIKN